MSRLNAANNGQTRLVGDITATAVSFYVIDAAVFPVAPFMISLDAEIMQVNTVLGNLLSGITRAQEGTTAATHVGDCLVENRWTAGMYSGLALTEDLGAKTSLLTTIKTTIVAAINEVLGLLNTHKTDTTTAHGINTFAKSAQEAWYAPTLLNAWVNTGSGFSTAGYMKDNFGFVHLKGCISSGAITNNMTLFTMPAGYRPTANLMFNAMSTPDGASMQVFRLTVEVGGNVRIGSNGAASQTLMLDGISFSTN